MNQNEKGKVQHFVFMCKFECTSLFRTVSPKLASGVIIFFFLLLGCDTTSILSHSHNTCHIPVGPFIHSFIHSFIYMDDGAVGGAGGGDVPSPAASVAVPVLTTGGPELNTCSTTVLKELHCGH